MFQEEGTGCAKMQRSQLLLVYLRLVVEIK